MRVNCRQCRHHGTTYSLQGFCTKTIPKPLYFLSFSSYFSIRFRFIRPYLSVYHIIKIKILRRKQIENYHFPHEQGCGMRIRIQEDPGIFHLLDPDPAVTNLPELVHFRANFCQKSMVKMLNFFLMFKDLSISCVFQQAKEINKIFLSEKC